MTQKMYVLVLMSLISMSIRLHAEDLSQEFVRVCSARDEVPSLSLYAKCEMSDSKQYQLWLDGELVREDGLTDGKDMTLVANESYVFVLSKMDGKNSVAYLQPRTGEEISKTNTRIADSAPLRAVLAGRSVSGIPLSRLVKSDLFRLHSVEPVEESPDLVSVEFSYGPDERNGFPFEITKATLTCDRSKDWFVRESFAESVKGASKVRATYFEVIVPGPLQNGVVLAKSYRQDEVVFGKEKRELTTEARIEYDLNAPDRRQFYLTYYGFPEPDFKTSYYWLLWLPVALVVGLLGWRMFMRK